MEVQKHQTFNNKDPSDFNNIISEAKPINLQEYEIDL